MGKHCGNSDISTNRHQQDSDHLCGMKHLKQQTSQGSAAMPHPDGQKIAVKGPPVLEKLRQQPPYTVYSYATRTAMLCCILRPLDHTTHAYILAGPPCLPSLARPPLEVDARPCPAPEHACMPCASRRRSLAARAAAVQCSVISHHTPQRLSWQQQRAVRTTHQTTSKCTPVCAHTQPT